MKSGAILHVDPAVKKLAKKRNKDAVQRKLSSGTASGSGRGSNTAAHQEQKASPTAKKLSGGHLRTSSDLKSKPPANVSSAPPSSINAGGASDLQKTPVDAPPVLPTETVDVPHEQMDSLSTPGGDKLGMSFKKLVTGRIDAKHYKQANAHQESDPKIFAAIYFWAKNCYIELVTNWNRLQYIPKDNFLPWVRENLTPDVASLISEQFSSRNTTRKSIVKILVVAAALMKYDLVELRASDLSGYKDIPLHTQDIRSSEQQKFLKKAYFENKSDMVVGHILGLGLILMLNLELPPEHRMDISCLKKIGNMWGNMQMETKAANQFNEAVDKKLRRPGRDQLTQAEIDRLREIVKTAQSDEFQKVMITEGGHCLYSRIRERMNEKVNGIWDEGKDEKPLKLESIQRNRRIVDRRRAKTLSDCTIQVTDLQYALNLYHRNRSRFNRVVCLYLLLEPSEAVRLRDLPPSKLKKVPIKGVNGSSLQDVVLNLRKWNTPPSSDHPRNLGIVAMARNKYIYHVELADIDFETDDKRLVGLIFLVKLNTQLSADKQASCAWICRIVLDKKNALSTLMPKSTTETVKSAQHEIANGDVTYAQAPTWCEYGKRAWNLLVLMARFLQSMPQSGMGDIHSAAECVLDWYVKYSVWQTAKAGKTMADKKNTVIYTGPRGGKFVITTRLATRRASRPISSRKLDGHPDMRFNANKGKATGNISAGSRG